MVCRMSYGTGRPAILKDDESIRNCRLLLQHPLAIEDDMRLVSMVELMAIRERVHNGLAPLFEKPVDDSTLNILRDADLEFRHWYQTWDQAFSQKYEDAGLSLHPSQRLYSRAHLSLQPSIDKVSSTNILRRNYSIMRLLSRVSRYLKMFRRCHLGRRSLPLSQFRLGIKFSISP